MRWLVALLCDSGLRLGEATALAKDDLVLDRPIPHIKVKPHPQRILKTVGSEREVPLIGISLWAAKRIKNNGSPFKFAFPRYTNDHLSNANSASAALNKWLKLFVPENCVIHLGIILETDCVMQNVLITLSIGQGGGLPLEQGRHMAKVMI